MKKVAVWIITYNHGEFLEKAIKNVLSQVVNFEFEIIIGVDLSEDNTLEIAKEYAARFPEKISVLSYKKRLGYQENFIRTLEACGNAEYIAMCEGDDYWCDKNKLQKQVDILDANSDYSLIFHDGHSINHEGQVTGNFSIGRLEKSSSGPVAASTILSAPLRFVHLSSICFRSSKLRTFLLRKHFKAAPVLDTPLINLIAATGRIYYIDTPMFCQRNHSKSITQQRSFDKAYYSEVKKMLLTIMYLLPGYESELKRAIKGRYASFLLHKMMSGTNIIEKLTFFSILIAYRKLRNYTMRDLFYLLKMQR